MRRNALFSSLVFVAVSGFAANSFAATVTTLKNPTWWRVTLNGIKYEPSDYSKCANLTDARKWNDYYWCPVSVGVLSAAKVAELNSTPTKPVAVAPTPAPAPTPTAPATSTFSVITKTNPTWWRVTLSGIKYEPSNYSKCSDKSDARSWNNYYWCPVSVGSFSAAEVAALTAGGGTTSPTAPSTGTGGGTVTVPVTYTAKLSWSAPSTREDGSPLPMSELKGYEIYYTNDALNISQTVSVANASTSSYAVSNLKAGTYHFAISAIDSKGVKSKLSPMVSTKFGS